MGEESEEAEGRGGEKEFEMVLLLGGLNIYIFLPSSCLSHFLSCPSHSFPSILSAPTTPLLTTHSPLFFLSF